MPPLLTIAIPTYNRAGYLRTCLAQIRAESSHLEPGNGGVQVIVSDNCSSDGTAALVQGLRDEGFDLVYVRNETNIGSDANIAQCFNLAAGRYVMLMGDDDVFVDGALSRLLHSLEQGDYGMVCLRSYGFESDFRREQPPAGHGETVYANLGNYLAKVAHLVTLISGCVINKSLLPEVDANTFCGGNLVQVHLCLLAASRARCNLFVHRYEIAVKRNNSGGYDHSRVFVKHLLDIVDGFVGRGLQASDVRRIERRLLVSYFPFYLFRLRLDRGDLQEAQRNFSARFEGQALYALWIKPALYWPRLPAMCWAAVTTAIGRSMGGDLTRGIYFLLHRVLRRA